MAEYQERIQEVPQRVQQKASDVKEVIRTGTWRERWPWTRILKWLAIIVAGFGTTAAVVVGVGLFLLVATLTAPVWIPLLLFVGLPLFVVFGIPTIAIVTVVGGGITSVVVGVLALFLTAAWLIQYFRGQHPPGSDTVDKVANKSKQGVERMKEASKTAWVKVSGRRY